MNYQKYARQLNEILEIARQNSRLPFLTHFNGPSSMFMWADPPTWYANNPDKLKRSDYFAIVRSDGIIEPLEREPSEFWTMVLTMLELER